MTVNLNGIGVDRSVRNVNDIPVQDFTDEATSQGFVFIANHPIPGKCETCLCGRIRLDRIWPVLRGPSVGAREAIRLRNRSRD
jgi:hypothetical protein